MQSATFVSQTLCPLYTVMLCIPREDPTREQGHLELNAKGGPDRASESQYNNTESSSEQIRQKGGGRWEGGGKSEREEGKRSAFEKVYS